MSALRVIAKELGISELSNLQLLQAFAAILEELRDREIARTSNNPVADYTEWLVCQCLVLKQTPNSNKGFDAVDPDGTRYEIKGRRITRHNSSTQFSAIRQLDNEHFDYLIGVVYEEDFTVRYGAKIPFELIAPNARFTKHANAHLLRLTPAIMALDGVENITSLLREGT